MTFNGKDLGGLGGFAMKHLLTGGSIGAGAILAMAIWDLSKSQPQLFIETFAKWGPGAALGMFAIVFVDRRLGQGMTLLRDNTKAQQQMADAVQGLVQKDDVRAREQELALDVITSRTEQIHQLLEELKHQGAARGAGA